MKPFYTWAWLKKYVPEEVRSKSNNIVHPLEVFIAEPGEASTRLNRGQVLCRVRSSDAPWPRAMRRRPVMGVVPLAAGLAGERIGVVLSSEISRENRSIPLLALV